MCHLHSAAVLQHLRENVNELLVKLKKGKKLSMNSKQNKKGDTFGLLSNLPQRTGLKTPIQNTHHKEKISKNNEWVI